MNIRDQRIVVSYPREFTKDNGTFKLVRSYDTDGFFILAYLVDLKNPESRAKYTDCWLKYGYQPTELIDGKHAREVKNYGMYVQLDAIDEQISDIKRMPLKSANFLEYADEFISSKTGTIKELVRELSKENEKDLDEFLEFAENTKIPELQSEMKFYAPADLPFAAKARKFIEMERHGLVWAISDLPLQIYLLPKVDSTRSVLHTENPLIIPPGKAEDYKWRLEFEKNVARTLEFEKINYNKDDIELIYRPILKSDIPEVFDLPSDANIDLLFAQTVTS